jgi:hypothetical protein
VSRSGTSEEFGSPAVSAIWRYRDMRPELLRPVELIRAKEAERLKYGWLSPGCCAYRLLIFSFERCYRESHYGFVCRLLTMG